MSTSFHNTDGNPVAFRLSFQPFHELESEQLAKKTAGAGARIKIATSPNNVLILFIISTIRTIQCQLHKPCKRDNSAACYFLSDVLGGIFQEFVLWCRFS